jgi:hypothetical protein
MRFLAPWRNMAVNGSATVSTGCSVVFGVNLVMAYRPLLIEMLAGINQQHTPSSLNRHTPEMTISLVQEQHTILGAPSKKPTTKDGL